MKTVKIVADSSANMLYLKHADFAVAPLKIITNEKEFVDNADLSADAMVTWLESYKGKSKTSCPNPAEWLDAFGDADIVYCVTITSGLSGSYNGACIAKQMYEDAHPERQVYVIDSLSAGPELVLLLEKLEEAAVEALDYSQTCQMIEAYQKQTGLVFMLESLKNFAANGRVSPAVAKIAGVLGIRVVGKASDHGTLEPMHKCRGEGKALSAICDHLKEAGLQRGKVRIAHCMNEAGAQELRRRILQQAPQAEIQIHSCRGLCSYYAEKGGLLVGFEKQ